MDFFLNFIIQNSIFNYKKEFDLDKKNKKA